jgi:protein-S-isoprenylcysteine O-methyltransferase Ste14
MRQTTYIRTRLCGRHLAHEAILDDQLRRRGLRAVPRGLLYLVGFVGGILVPRTVDHGIAAPIGQAIVVNAALVALFGVQHSVMARPWFKRWWTRFVPASIERSTYVWLSNAVLVLLYWQWRTMPTVIWQVDVPAGRQAVWVLFWLGWATALTSTFLINHFDLFGLRQVYLAWREKPYEELRFNTRLLYRLVRHPLRLGFLIAFWSAPTMTAGTCSSRSA